MRIIGGKYQRRKINPPKNLPVRPTTDLAKESLFNILQNKIEFNDAAALDLFSGTGSMAYEFVSRGCASVVAVDQNIRCTGFIKQTAELMGMDELKVVRNDVFRFLRLNQPQFNIIFADPPYQMENISEISILIFAKNLLKPVGWLVVEHPGKVDLSGQEHFIEHRRYGHVNFSFFQNRS